MVSIIRRLRRHRPEPKTMSTTAEAPSLISSMPNDIVLNVLARIPRRYYPTLSCVSKTLRSLVRSSELHKTRSLLEKDYCFYVCFEESLGISKTYHWFTLNEDRRLVSVPFTSPPKPYSATLMVGHEIYFVGGSFSHTSKNMWILNSRSGKLRRGPSPLVATRSASAVGLVDDKICIFGGRKDKILMQMLDLKRQTWKITSNPSVKVHSEFISLVTPSLGRQIYARNHDEYHIVSCVVDNVLFMYHERRGLMWCNFKEKQWRIVHGLKLDGYLSSNVAMADYNGKLAFLWRKKKKIWCSMITFSWISQVEIQGRVEWSSCLLSNVPSHYYFKHCLGLE